MDVCFYFQLHQPLRMRRFRIFDIGTGVSYFDDETNHRILNRVCDGCYVPALEILQHLIDRAGARFALGISGVLLEQLQSQRPDVLASLQRIVASGSVEVVSETSHHSLASLTTSDEFAEQIRLHGALMKKLLGVTPRTFRNTEMIVDDALLTSISQLGFTTALVEGADRVLDGRSPNHVFSAAAAPKLRLLPRHYRLSDDIAFRFTDQHWTGWPLTADKYAAWVAAAGGDLVNLFMDFETFGEHHPAASGILDFLRALPSALDRVGARLVTPSEAAKRKPAGRLAFPSVTSWADTERDASAWQGNKIQRAAHQRLYDLRPAAMRAADKALALDWRRLTTSDHFYYMSTKWRADGDVHTYFNPHASPYDAYISFMNIARDLEQRASKRRGVKTPTRSPTAKGQKPKAKRAARPAKRAPKRRKR